MIFSLAGMLFLTSSVSNASSQPVSPKPSEIAATSARPFQNIHLYGQVPQPGQLRKSYLVFQQNGDRVIGAYYQPRSEFDCFIGTIEDQQLDVDIVNALGKRINEAQISLPNLYSFPKLGDNEKRMLSICRQELSDR